MIGNGILPSGTLVSWWMYVFINCSLLSRKFLCDKNFSVGGGVSRNELCMRRIRASEHADAK